MNRALVVLLAGLLAVGCSSKAESNDAIQKAILAYLATRPGLDVSKMDVSITKVTRSGEVAEVDVLFTAKGAPSGQGMAMHYSLTKAGDSWSVKAPSGGHAGAGMEQAQPPAGNPHAGVPGAPPITSGGEKAGSGGSFRPDVGKSPGTVKQ